MWVFPLAPTSWSYAKMRAMVPPCPPGWVGVEPSRRTLKLQILWVICMFSTGAWLPGVKLHNISSGKHIPDFSLVQPSKTSGSRHWFLSLHSSIFILQVCRSLLSGENPVLTKCNISVDSTIACIVFPLWELLAATWHAVAAAIAGLSLCLPRCDLLSFTLEARVMCRLMPELVDQLLETKIA